MELALCDNLVGFPKSNHIAIASYVESKNCVS